MNYHKTKWLETIINMYYPHCFCGPVIQDSQLSSSSSVSWDCTEESHCGYNWLNVLNGMEDLFQDGGQCSSLDWPHTVLSSIATVVLLFAITILNIFSS